MAAVFEFRKKLSSQFTDKSVQRDLRMIEIALSKNINRKDFNKFDKIQAINSLNTIDTNTHKIAESYFNNFNRKIIYKIRKELSETILFIF